MIDWDRWRADYRNLSFEDQQLFYDRVGIIHSKQRCYDSAAISGFLESNKPDLVVEVGGWNGEMAEEMLGRFPSISSWTNYEICPSVHAVCSDSRYNHHLIDRFPWESRLVGDSLVLSHVVEHILLLEFRRMIEMFTGETIYIECPVDSGDTNWSGYNGSHIIESGWDAIGQQMPAFSCNYSAGEVRWYQRNA